MRAILIVGMHRSGTSCLTGSLEQAGLPLGEVITTAPHNAKGNRENRRIMDFHEALLRDNGGSWDCPPDRVVWSDSHRATRDSILEDYTGSARFGFKDPRTLFTLEGWLEVLAGVSYVGTFRHPLAVAQSLKKRNGGELERWVALWIRYNERMLALYDKTPFPIVSFDEPDDVYRESVLRTVLRLELSTESSGAFFEPGLRHHAGFDGPVPEDARRLYERLQEISKQ